MPANYLFIVSLDRKVNKGLKWRRVVYVTVRIPQIVTERYCAAYLCVVH